MAIRVGSARREIQKLKYVGLTVRSKRLLALLCTHVKSILPFDVWMVLSPR